jgi:2-polyprenyl-3-methyl-5-hydroxy-6-metoxy-1,4-benzoquinol methylase
MQTWWDKNRVTPPVDGNNWPSIEIIRSVLGTIHGKLLLDCGSGVGCHIERYTAEGARVVGFDLTIGMIEECI